jgi:hypothetical protein
VPGQTPLGTFAALAGGVKVDVEQASAGAAFGGMFLPVRPFPVVPSISVSFFTSLLLSLLLVRLLRFFVFYYGVGPRLDWSMASSIVIEWSGKRDELAWLGWLGHFVWGCVLAKRGRRARWNERAEPSVREEKIVMVAVCMRAFCT